MKALILDDGFNCPKLKSDLLQELTGLGIEPVIIPSLAGFDSLKVYSEPMLFYQSTCHRLKSPKLILEFHNANNFQILYNQGQILSFKPQETHLLRDRIAPRRKSFVFNVHGNYVETVEPETKHAIHTVILAHNRPEYFRLTLNSLLWSLKRCSSPITVLINEAFNEAGQAILSLCKKHTDKVIAYGFKENLSFHAIKVWTTKANIKPNDVLIIGEDDFILPPSISYAFPAWPKQIAARLKHFDLVGFSTNLDNAPVTLGLPEYNVDYLYRWHNFFHKEHTKKKVPVMGNMLATTFEKWQKAEAHPKHGIPLDINLLKMARSFSMPGLKGYHIGWNADMDNVGKSIKKSYGEVDPTREHSMLLL